MMRRFHHRVTIRLGRATRNENAPLTPARMGSQRAAFSVVSSNRLLVVAKGNKHVMRRGRPGFSLMEMMCALVLMVIGVLAVFGLLTMGVTADTTSGNFSSARAAALQILETAREQGAGNEANALTVLGLVADAANPASGLYVMSTPTQSTSPIGLPDGARVAFTVTQNFNGFTGCNKVAVTVFWKAPERGKADTTDATHYGNCSVSLSTCTTSGGLNGHDMY